MKPWILRSRRQERFIRNKEKMDYYLGHFLNPEMSIHIDGSHYELFINNWLEIDYYLTNEDDERSRRVVVYQTTYEIFENRFLPPDEEVEFLRVHVQVLFPINQGDITRYAKRHFYD